MTGPDRPTQTLEAWAFVRQMLEDMTPWSTAESETELELLEGLRVLGRVTALCSELSLDVDPEAPWFFSMNTEARLVGGPNPDGEYLLAMIDGRHRYRITGRRGTVAYLGFQVLAGVGLTPRRMAAYVSDRELGSTDPTGLLLRPGAEEPPRPSWPGRPGCRSPRTPRPCWCASTWPTAPPRVWPSCRIDPLDPAGPPDRPDRRPGGRAAHRHGLDHRQADHPAPDGHAGAAGHAQPAGHGRGRRPGRQNTTPDNLYMLGTFRLADGEALVLDAHPPDTRYWSVTVENIWHECIDPRRRPARLTNATRRGRGRRAGAAGHR